VPAAVWVQACLGQGQDQRGMGSRVAQLRERLGVEVVHGVARLVIAGVVRLTCRAAVDGSFLWRLDLLSTAEELTRWNTSAMNGP